LIYSLIRPLRARVSIIRFQTPTLGEDYRVAQKLSRKVLVIISSNFDRMTDSKNGPGPSTTNVVVVLTVFVVI